VPFDRDGAAEMTGDLVGRLSRSLREGTAVDRRTVLGGLGLAGGAAVVGSAGRSAGAAPGHDEAAHGNFAGVGEYRSDDFDPHDFLTNFYDGTGDRDDLDPRVYEERVRGETRTVRHFRMTAVRRPIEIAPGVTFTAWTYNGQVPGPTLRATEGDVVRVTFDNADTHAHTIHPHLRNLAPEMDGIPQNGPGVLDAEDDPFTYQWLAQPAGVHFYHCHSLPLKEHIHRGLYGAMIVDPDPERVREHPRDYVNYHGPIDDAYRDRLVEQARRRHRDHVDDYGINEMVMVMNGFDTNFDGDNEVYAANTRAFAYGVADTEGEGVWSGGDTIHPIAVDRDELQRVYLVNTIEFDPINSFHSHSQFFDYYDHGTTLYPTHSTIDTVMQCQAQRGILELDYSGHDPGLYMFHAHQSEFAELGWMSFFDVGGGA
jgi:FtsP/CotA-like multicopper oxidase with cupredoxin domain